MGVATNGKLALEADQPIGGSDAHVFGQWVRDKENGIVVFTLVYHAPKDSNTAELNAAFAKTMNVCIALTGEGRGGSPNDVLTDMSLLLRGPGIWKRTAAANFTISFTLPEAIFLRRLPEAHGIIINFDDWKLLNQRGYISPNVAFCPHGLKEGIRALFAD